MKPIQPFFVLIALFATAVLSVPAVERDNHASRDSHAPRDNDASIHYARSVCQLGSIFGAGDAACTADCIARGKGLHGGFCNDRKW